MDKEISELMRFIKSVFILVLAGIVTTGLLYVAIGALLLAKLSQLQ